MKFRRTKFLVVVLATTLWGVVGSPAKLLADGVIRDGLGAISGGRGGTNIANSDNGQVLLDNPAGMINVAGGGLFEFSADVLLTDLEYSDPQNNDVQAALQPFPLPQLSIIRKSDDGLWAFGFGLYAPAGFGAQFNLEGPPPALTGPQRYKSIGGLGKVLPGVACKLTDRLSVGGTLGVAVSHVELEGPFFLQTGPLANTPTIMDLQGTGADIAWSLGAQYWLTDRTVVGISYQSETDLKLDGNARATVPLMGQGRFDASTHIVWPQSLGMGVRHDVSPYWRFSSDVIWFDWKGSFNEIGLRLTNPDNPAFAPLAPIEDRFPLKWDHSVSLRLGAEHFISKRSVIRAGYAYHRNQIPEATLTPYIPAILEHAFSLGWGREFRKWRFDAAYQFSWGRDRHVSASDLVGGDFDNSRVQAQAHWVYFSFLRKRPGPGCASHGCDICD